MKSKRAGEYLKGHLGTFPLEAYVGAMKSVEIAEEDMIEKAVKAFAEACEIHRHVVFGGTPACDDAINPEATSGIGKTIIVTLRKWFGKPTRDNL